MGMVADSIRWILYNHRILSFLVFTTAFFTVSMTSALTAYLAFRFYMWSSPPESGPVPGKKLIKTEPEDADQPAFNPLSTSDMSDTARSFPTRGRQMPLRFPSPADAAERMKNEPQVKIEDFEDDAVNQPLMGEADDEVDDDDDDVGSAWRDSGIGTGMEESAVWGGKKRGKQSRQLKREQE